MDSSDEDINAPLQEAVNQMMERIDKSRLRAFQRNTYLRMAACFESTTTTSRQVQNCVEQSSHGLKQAQQIIDHELKHFQTKISRCTEVCQDEATDSIKYSANPSREEESQVQEKLKSCYKKCVDKHVDMIKSIEGQLNRNLDQLAKK